ncbi:MAG: hypothetical protein QM704_08365 [Anaeromyxobacteraceae bacterium]
MTRLLGLAGLLLGLSACGVCEPNVQRCTDNRIEVCEDGTRWRTADDCSAGAKTCTVGDACPFDLKGVDPVCCL